jgi:hypothetical protein
VEYLYLEYVASSLLLQQSATMGLHKEEEVGRARII